MRKTALITGAAGGIGSATARLIASKGWAVALVDSSMSHLTALVEQMAPSVAAGNLLPLEADVTSVQDVQRVIRETAKWSDGQLNLLIHAAGLMEVGDFDRIAPERHKQLLLVNVWGVENVTHAALPLLMDSNPACIVNMSSVTALYGTPDLTTYAATKAAVRSLTESWDLAYGPKGIRVCDLMPIFVRTGMVESNLDRFARNPEKKIRLTPEDIAQSIWKAVHGKKLHYPVGLDTRLFVQLDRILPARMRRWVVRKVGGYA